MNVVSNLHNARLTTLLPQVLYCVFSSEKWWMCVYLCVCSVIMCALWQSILSVGYLFLMMFSMVTS